MIAALLGMLAFLLLPSDALAWGFETHIRIGFAILENHPPLALIPHQAAFMLGNIFPDFFNLFKDFSKIKKQLPTHSWDTVRLLFDNAATLEEKAFAHGYAAHLAADIVAHNYLVPQEYVLTSGSRLLSHFMVEAADEQEQARSGGRYHLTLYHLLDHAEKHGELFLRTFSIDRAFFRRQLRMLRTGVSIQNALSLGSVARLVARNQSHELSEKLAYYREHAEKAAIASVSKGFEQFSLHDPSGKERMEEAKQMRKNLFWEIGRSGIRNLRGQGILSTYDPEGKV